MQYKIITQKQVYKDLSNSNLPLDSEQYLNEKYEECLKILNANYINLTDSYIFYFFNSHWYSSQERCMTIEDCFQYLPIKDGVDVIQFSDDNIGFVSYYNGYKQLVKILKSTI